MASYNMGEVNVPARDLAKDIYVNVRITGLKPFKIRVLVALWLLALARIIAPFNIVMEEDKDKQ